MKVIVLYENDRKRFVTENRKFYQSIGEFVQAELLHAHITTYYCHTIDTDLIEDEDYIEVDRMLDNTRPLGEFLLSFEYLWKKGYETDGIGLG